MNRRFHWDRLVDLFGHHDYLTRWQTARLCWNHFRGLI